MNPIREQARKAVALRCQDPSSADYDLADASSDVWEPLLIEACDALAASWQSPRDVNYVKLWETLKRIEEALGR